MTRRSPRRTSRLTKSSAAWLARQRRDPYAGRAVSRAYFKLEQLDARFRLTGRDRVVLELGAAPGGWTEYLGPRCRLVVACDLLPLAAVPAGVRTVLGDAREPSTQRRILATAGVSAERPFDVVLSDMAPNISGNRVRDQAVTLELVECTLGLAERWLRPGGRVVVKTFHGAGFDDLVRDVRARFADVVMAKPGASRGGSREVYATGRYGVE
ncbi:MAG: RlmE family RNA methyltransferase [Gammaproteobacteria bacterium]|nr:RlmE family RNA methyltransferase [Gammaproteobacteria bacterium]